MGKWAESDNAIAKVAATRFAPSPSGRLHIGHAFAALCAHDFARNGGGRFLLRIEDIDGTRSRPEHITGIIEDMAWLTQNSPLPTIADESLQRLPDVMKAYGVYTGINIKLMKCTGMREAHQMLTLARLLDMKVMIGCMTETSCGISAAAQLAPKADWADLDGNLLISNDPFTGMQIIDGKVKLVDKPGIGIKVLEKLF